MAIDLKLPQSPPKLQRRPSQETLAASPLSPASVPGSDSGPVLFQTVGNHVLVMALLNRKEGLDHGVGNLAYIPTKNDATQNFMPKPEGGGIQ